MTKWSNYMSKEEVLANIRDIALDTIAVTVNDDSLGAGERIDRVKGMYALLVDIDFDMEDKEDGKNVQSV